MGFIGEQIEVGFEQEPVFRKKPHCPDRFTWGQNAFRVVTVLREWHDYRRRGRMAHNMRPEHAQAASRRGSWGVGRDYFRVRTEDGRIFEIYYDRSPKDSEGRKGAWYLFRELGPDEVETG
jgi:hypothetical protein